jgi:PilZ domain-containing protein
MKSSQPKTGGGRRRYARFPIVAAALIECKTPFRRRLRAETRDISRGGLYFFSEMDLPVGSIFHFEMPFSSANPPRSVCALIGAGQIVRRELVATKKIGFAARFERIQLLASPPSRIAAHDRMRTATAG